MGKGLRHRLGRDLDGMLDDDVRSLGLGLDHHAEPPSVVEAAEVAELPDVVQRYLDVMGVVGLPRVVSFRGRFVGRFRLRPGGRWLRCQAEQYSSAHPVGRAFRMRVDLPGRIPMIGIDSYAGGEGRMLGRLLGLVTVADGSGPALDLGELTTYLNDAVLIAPSMLLGPSTTWTGVDDRTFDVALTDRDLTATARVTLDRNGRPVSFTSDDRSLARRNGTVRARWTTPIDRWTRVRGRALPVHACATWTLPDGAFTYVDGAIDPWTIAWNPPVGAAAAVSRPAPAPPVPGALGGAARIVANLVGAPVLHRRTSTWGATPDEVAAPLDGDRWVPDPKLTSTRAVTIDAPPGVVWSWLVQIGHDRGGLYSYDRLENLIGCDLHSAERIRPDLQVLEVGDIVALGPTGYPCHRVVAVDPGRSLVLVGADPKTRRVPNHPVGADEVGSCWQWSLRPLDGGRATRLVARQRTSYPDRTAPLWRLVEPIDFVMEQRMLLGIKERAERLDPLSGAA